MIYCLARRRDRTQESPYLLISKDMRRRRSSIRTGSVRPIRKVYIERGSLSTLQWKEQEEKGGRRSGSRRREEKGMLIEDE